MAERFLMTNDVALALRCSPQNVRKLEKQGKLSAQRTAGGYRLFIASEVERLAAERAQNIRTAGAAGSGNE
jgi:DNA-binding transcriptional MerR regulator